MNAALNLRVSKAMEFVSGEIVGCFYFCTTSTGHIQGDMYICKYEKMM